MSVLTLSPISFTIQYCEQNGITQRRITPLWPQANGEIERQNKSFLKRLKITHTEKKNWKEELQKYLFMYRATIHSTTGVSLAELLFGRKIRTKLPELENSSMEDIEVRGRDHERKDKGKISRFPMVTQLSGNAFQSLMVLGK